MKLLTNFDNASRNPPLYSLQCDWSKFTSLSLAVMKMRQIYWPQVAFGKILQDHRRIPACIFRVKIAAVGSVKRAQKGFLRLVSNFIEGNKSLKFDVYSNKASKKFQNIWKYTESTYLI
jgi:hypothetical protein